MKNICITLACAAALVTSACAPMRVAVKDINANPATYLDENFNESKLPESLKTKLGISANNGAKRTLTLKIRQEFTEGDKSQVFTAQHKAVVQNNGLVRELVEYRKNDFRTSYSFRLMYGIFAIRYQLVNAASNYANTLDQYTEVSADEGFTHPDENKKYSAMFSVTRDGQLTSYATVNLACSSRDSVPASSVSPKLTGKAIPFDCERIGSNGQVFMKESYAYLADFGVFLEQQVSTSQNKRVYTLEDVTIN